MKLRIIPAGGPQRLVERDTQEKLAQMRGIISAKSVTPLKVKWKGKDTTLWCDEDGLPRGLMINEQASLVAGRMLVGDVIIEER